MVPAEVVQSLALVTEALQAPVVLIGGWAVRCRLLMARSASRPTDDLDILLVTTARPARAALEAVNAVQSDPSHPCRLDGLPLLVDVPADELPSGVAPGRPGRVDERIEDPDGLNLLVPPFGGLLARSAEPMRLLATDEEAKPSSSFPWRGHCWRPRRRTSPWSSGLRRARQRRRGHRPAHRRIRHPGTARRSRPRNPGRAGRPPPPPPPARRRRDQRSSPCVRPHPRRRSPTDHHRPAERRTRLRRPDEAHHPSERHPGIAVRVLRTVGL